MRSVLRTSRPILAVAIGTVGIVLVTAVLFPFGEDVTRAAPALFLLLPVLVAGVVGGRLAAVLVALEATFAFASGFLPPIGSPAVDELHDQIAAVSFVVVAVSAGIVMATFLWTERARSAALERLDLDRSALLRSVSHDLRTPLATIRAAATGLRSEVPFDDETRAELLGLVADEAERLDRLVRNLLSLSRIEAGRFLPEPEAVDLGDLVESCITRQRRALGDVRIELAPNAELVLVHADHVQVDQVISNLLENAVRHSPPGGRVHVAYTTDGPVAVVSVLDEGPGVPPEQRQRVFEPFSSLSGSTSTGIGLAICRSVVEAHGGTISVDDGPHGGAWFSFTLPITR
jgi:two-component system sensor histidine kinase KdpD